MPTAVASHSALTGLGNDDHTQYFNQTRGDARYRQLASALAISDITGLAAALALLMSTTTALATFSQLGHMHVIGDTTGLQTALDSKLLASLAGVFGLLMLATATASAGTALLSTMIGDSGSGGTKGLVPAPALGMAALGYFLAADGTFKAPPGGGGVVASDFEPSVFIATDSSDGNILLTGLYTLQTNVLTAGLRILPSAQTNATENRVHLTNASAWTLEDGWTNADTVSSGRIVPIEAGDNIGAIARLTTVNPIVLGTTNLNWLIDSPSAIVPVVNYIARNISAPTQDLSLALANSRLFATRVGAQTFNLRTNAQANLGIGSGFIIVHVGTGTKTIKIVSHSKRR